MEDIQLLLTTFNSSQTNYITFSQVLEFLKVLNIL